MFGLWLIKQAINLEHCLIGWTPNVIIVGKIYAQFNVRGNRLLETFTDTI